MLSHETLLPTYRYLINEYNLMNTLHTFAKRAAVASATMLALFVMIVPTTASAAVLTRQLELTMKGSDVSTLQTFLALDNTIYPQGLVTGYFGTLTKSAVSNFQSRNNIATVGRVGPQTLAVINAQMAGGASISGDIDAATITNLTVSRSSTAATIFWNTSEETRGVVYYSTSPLNETEYENTVTVIGATTAMTDIAYRSSQNITLNGLQSNTTYYYLVHTTDQSGNVSVSVPMMFTTAL